MGSTRSVPATLGLPPAHGMCFPRLHCSGSRLLYMERALCCSFPVPHKNSDSVGPVFCAFPRPSSSGRQELEGRTLPSAVRLLPSTAPAPASVSVPASVGCVRLVSVLGSWPLAVILPLDVDHPESQEVSLWLQTGGLFAVWWGCHLWGQVCPFPLPPASCLRWGLGRSTAS